MHHLTFTARHAKTRISCVIHPRKILYLVAEDIAECLEDYYYVLSIVCVSTVFCFLMCETGKYKLSHY